MNRNEIAEYVATLEEQLVMKTSPADYAKVEKALENAKALQDAYTACVVDAESNETLHGIWLDVVQFDSSEFGDDTEY